MSQLRRIGTCAVGRCMEFLHWVGDFASATARATEYARCSPCDAGRTMLGQLRRVGTGTVGRCMEFARCVCDFAFLPRRVTEPGRCRRRDAASTLNQLRRVRSGTVGRCIGFFRCGAISHSCPAAPSAAPRRMAPRPCFASRCSARRVAFNSRMILCARTIPAFHGARASASARANSRSPARLLAGSRARATNRPPSVLSPAAWAVVPNHNIGRVHGVDRRVQLRRIVQPRRQVPWQIRLDHRRAPITGPGPSASSGTGPAHSPQRCKTHAWRAPRPALPAPPASAARCSCRRASGTAPSPSPATGRRNPSFAPSPHSAAPGSGCRDGCRCDGDVAHRSAAARRQAVGVSPDHHNRRGRWPGRHGWPARPFGRLPPASRGWLPSQPASSPLVRPRRECTIAQGPVAATRQQRRRR